MPVGSHDLVLIGHLSKDIIIIDNERKASSVGGSVYYAAFAAKPAEIQLLVVTKLAIQDYEMLAAFWQHGLSVLPLFCSQTTVMEDIFEKQNHYSRRSRVLSLASPFTAEIYLIAGLL